MSYKFGNFFHHNFDSVYRMSHQKLCFRSPKTFTPKSATNACYPLKCTFSTNSSKLLNICSSGGTTCFEKATFHLYSGCSSREGCTMSSFGHWWPQRRLVRCSTLAVCCSGPVRALSTLLWAVQDLFGTSHFFLPLEELGQGILACKRTKSHVWLFLKSQNVHEHTYSKMFKIWHCSSV